MSKRFHKIAAPDEIPAGTSEHIAASIRRTRLEEEQRRILEHICHQVGMPVRLQRRYRKRAAAKYRNKIARRMRISAAPEHFTREEIIARDHSICQLCGNACERHDIHIDHDLPLSRGGQHTRSNVHVAHAECNLRKGHMTTAEYRATLGLHSPVATRTNE